MAIVVEDKADVAKMSGFNQEDRKKPEKKQPPVKPDNEEEKPDTIEPKLTPIAPKVDIHLNEKNLVSPAARSMAQEHGIDLHYVKGSGPRGLVSKGDVLAYIETGQKSVQKPVAFRDIPLTTMRRVIAERLSQSKRTIPHYSLTCSIKMDRVSEIRKQLNAEQDLKLSINDFVLKAAGHALLAVPEVNASWIDNNGGHNNEPFIRQYSSADICVAVALDPAQAKENQSSTFGGELLGGGLLTPVIRNVQDLNLLELSSKIKSLVQLARANRLKPEDLAGGTFTMSNLGGKNSCIDAFTAIINPPQAAILAVGRVQDEDGKNVMQCTLCCDHRVVDGAVGAKWLKAFKAVMEEPALSAIL